MDHNITAKMCHSTVFNAVYSHGRITAIQPHAANQGEFCVSPVQTLVEVVHCQTYTNRAGLGNV